MKEVYHWKTKYTISKFGEVLNKDIDQKILQSALGHEKNQELIIKLTEEVLQRDTWASEIVTLNLPTQVQQLALNTWKEKTMQGIYLHLRSNKRHLNSVHAQRVLTRALSFSSGKPVNLSVIEDDNPAVLTPIELRQKIYEEKIIQARQSIITDRHIQALCRIFNADLDEESIHLI